MLHCAVQFLVLEEWNCQIVEWVFSHSAGYVTQVLEAPCVGDERKNHVKESERLQHTNLLVLPCPEGLFELPKGESLCEQ